MAEISIVKCNSYNPNEVSKAMDNLIDLIGKLYSSNTLINVEPTSPVAPTIATLYAFILLLSLNWIYLSILLNVI